MKESSDKEDRRERAWEAREERAREAQQEEERQQRLEQVRLREEAAEQERVKLQNYNYYATQADNFYNAEDYVQALANYLAAASYRDDMRCQYRIGHMYFNGLGNEVNMDEALKWYRLSAENGHLDGKNDTGAVYEDMGDYDNALHWYKLSAEGGYDWSIKNLVRLYSKNYEMSEQHRQDIESQRRWSEQYITLAEISTHADFKEDIIGAYNILASIYLGENEFKDVEKGKYYLENLADHDTAAAFYLGRFYINGYLYEEDIPRGITWIVKVANQNSGYYNDGVLEAQVYLGNLYRDGYKGVVKDKIKSDAYYKKYLKSAIKGNLNGNVAAMYKRGIGTPLNYAEAVKWQKRYIKDIEKTIDTVDSPVGYIIGRDYDFLGDIYAKGGYGVVKNPIEAAKWYKKGFDILIQEREMMGGSLTEGGIEMAVDTVIGTEVMGKKFNYHYPELKDYELTNFFVEIDEDSFNLTLLGYRYEKGIGTTANILKAIEWYEKERETGMAIPCDIGLMRIYSKAKDKDKTEEWYKKLVEDIERLLDEMRRPEFVNTGAPEAGELYYNAAAELEKEKSILGNLAKAKELYKKSAELGYKKANQAITRMEKPPVKKK